jgi:hypothetical protein
MNKSCYARRTRWTIVLAGGEPFVMLAYDEDQIRRHYEGRGKTVVRITKGDFRKTQPPRLASTGFVIDNAVLDDAKDLLGLQKPVKIRFNNRVGGTLGNHRFRLDGYHDIMLKRYLSADRANKTLWHELTHAMQAERSGDYNDWVIFSKAQRKISYDKRPIEIEAREMADQMKDIKLIKEKV